MGATSEPKGAKRDVKGAKREQKGSQREPKGAKRRPKGDQNASKNRLGRLGRFCVQKCLQLHHLLIQFRLHFWSKLTLKSDEKTVCFIVFSRLWPFKENSKIYAKKGAKKVVSGPGAVACRWVQGDIQINKTNKNKQQQKEKTQAEGRYAEGMHAESITTHILTRPGRLRARSGYIGPKGPPGFPADLGPGVRILGATSPDTGLPVPFPMLLAPQPSVQVPCVAFQSAEFPCPFGID